MNPEVRDHIENVFTLSGFVGSIVTLIEVPDFFMRLIVFAPLTAIWIFLGVRMFIRELSRRRTANAIAGVKELKTVKDLKTVTAERTFTYIIEPATIQDIEWSVHLRASVYQRQDALPEHILKEWYSTNPNGFFIVKIENGPRVGHIDLLPIKPTSLRELVKGRITEDHIRGDSLYTPKEKESVRDLYIEGVICRLPEDHLKQHLGLIALKTILLSLDTMVENVSNPRKLEYVYAIAATRAGQKLMDFLGFEQQQIHTERKDKHDLYFAKFSTVRII
jgi:hypothetical protein